MHSYEVAIVGGGPAGLSTALFLANAAPELTERIVVLEKARYPREKICAGGVGSRADKLLRGIGVDVQVPSVPVSRLSLRTAAGGSNAPVVNMGRVVRRAEFDHALALKVRERGIMLREGAQVSQLQRNAAGIELETATGHVQARVLIGADGVSGIVRRWLGLGASLHRAQVIELDTEQVAADLPRDTLHFDYFDPGFTGYAWDFPTLVQGEALMCRGVYHLKGPGQSLHDIQDILAQRLRERGLDIARYRIKRFAECGFEPHRSYASERVALVGEAAGIDAFSGEGIAQAIEYGAFAGRYLAEKLKAGDLRFNDWNKRLSHAPVGFDLHMREWWLRQYFGPRRGAIERHLINQPSFVQSIGEQLSGSNSAYWHLLQAFGAAGMQTLKHWAHARS